MIRAAALLLLLAALLAGALHLALTTAMEGQGDAVVEIAAGSSARAVGRTLHEAGLVAHPLLFEMEARFTGRARTIHAGEYRIPRGLSVRQVAGILAGGKTILHRVTVPEGLTIAETAAVMAKAGIVGAQEFLLAASAAARGAPAWLGGVDSLEGFLFPETYSFPKRVPPGEIIAAMLAMFRSKASVVLPPEVMADPARMRATVTLASIIEKETGAPEERPLIASVFVNRLARGMPLQSDPTVIFAIPGFGGNLRKSDLALDSPYNTYRRRGLPPGPIASPGAGSLSAAVNPAPADYLYFVSRNDGSHQFSTTLAEHNAAVRRYQLAAK